VTDPSDIARSVGLRYVSDTRPGIRRRPMGKGFRYSAADGRPVRDPRVLRRIRALAIPPAWTDVWICPSGRGHIQATGRDARGRKQYRYHARWRAARDRGKFERLAAFGAVLPRIRHQVREDLRLRGLPRRKVLAVVVALLDATLIRVGNEEYARVNHSYGLTTMRDGHVGFDGDEVRFRFRGKSGKQHEVSVRDRRLARIVARCRDLPGQELFQYVDGHGRQHPVDSGDVNGYLREAAGLPITAKDFRTWAGTVLCACALCAAAPADTEARAKRAVARAIEATAGRLGNTPAVCRESYVHPAVVEAYVAGDLPALPAPGMDPTVCGDGLRPEEAAVLALLARKPATGRAIAGRRTARRTTRPETAR
jgi:DNA topoisomerase-1